MPRRLTLDLAFPPLTVDLEGLAVEVILEDVAEADAPAGQLARQTFTDQSVSRSAPVLSLPVDLPDVVAEEPAIRVHVRRDLMDAIRPGDFINPVRCSLPAPDQRHCRIPLVEIR